MKKNLFSLVTAMLLLAVAQTARAKSVVINTVDNQQVKYNVSQIESITFLGKIEFVNLDLPSGTLWATTNIGASKPENYGDYFAWGETKIKEDYSWNTYRYCQGTSESMTKYCTAEYYGTFDGRATLQAGDDAAAKTWGSPWQMPSMEQFEELINSDYTTVKKTFQNDVYGMLITSKKNGQSIFLPAAGIRMDTELINDGSRAFYWSSEVARPENFLARDFSFTTTSNTPNDTKNRCYGLSIRPVRNNKHKYVDLGLPSGTLWATTNIGADNPADYGDYFAWGETKPKSEYKWSNYKWMTEGQEDWIYINKYTSDDGFTEGCWYSDGYFIGDGLTRLLPEDDAATANWGQDWQMPNRSQWVELIGNTTYEWTSKTGNDGLQNYGYLFTSKTNGNCIFIPASGYNGEGKDTVFEYWLINHSVWDTGCAICFQDLYKGTDADGQIIETRGVFGSSDRARCIGRPVRPVWKK